MGGTDLSGKKKSKKISCEDIGHYVHHKDENGVDRYFGNRNASAWGKILFFYLCYYLMLTAFFGACMAVMVDSLPAWNEGPRLQDIIEDTEQINLIMLPGRLSNKKTFEIFPNNPEEAAEEATKVKEFLETSDVTVPGVEAAVDAFCGPNLGYGSTSPCFFLQFNRIRGRMLFTPPTTPAYLAAQGDISQFQATVDAATGDIEASFIPITCYLKEDEDLAPGSPQRDGKFEVVSFLNNTNTITSVPGLVFRKFANDESSLYYRDPTVVVKVKNQTLDGDGVLIENVNCDVFYVEDSDDTTTNDRTQRVITEISSD